MHFCGAEEEGNSCPFECLTSICWLCTPDCAIQHNFSVGHLLKMIFLIIKFSEAKVADTEVLLTNITIKLFSSCFVKVQKRK